MAAVRCDLCGASVSGGYIQRHMSSLHPETCTGPEDGTERRAGLRSVAKCCDECGTILRSPTGLLHLFSHHSPRTQRWEGMRETVERQYRSCRESRRRNSLTCDECGTKVNQPAVLAAHFGHFHEDLTRLGSEVLATWRTKQGKYRLRAKLSAISCDACGRRFEARRSFILHQFSEHGVEALSASVEETRHRKRLSMLRSAAREQEAPRMRCDNCLQFGPRKALSSADGLFKHFVFKHAPKDNAAWQLTRAQALLKLSTAAKHRLATKQADHFCDECSHGVKNRTKLFQHFVRNHGRGESWAQRRRLEAAQTAAVNNTKMRCDACGLVLQRGSFPSHLVSRACPASIRYRPPPLPFPQQSL